MKIPDGTIVLEPRDPLDAAIIDVHGGAAVYSFDRLRAAFMRLNPEWTRHDAAEWIGFNVESGPCYVEDDTPDP